MPPPVTPSPHRFLPPSSARTQGRPLPPSSLRKQHDSSSQRFRPTPRFTTQSDASNQIEPIDSPTSSPLVTHGSRAGKLAANEANSGLDGGAPNAPSSDDEILPESTTAQKRKRTPSPSRSARRRPGEAHELIVLSSSPPDPRLPSASPVAASFPTERSREAAPPRFRLPGDRPPETPAAPRIGDPAAPLLRTSRPGFVLPPREEGPPILPEAFSPHKKGSKVFEAGGMANTVRDWILTLESKHSRSVLDDSSRRRKSGLDQGHGIVVDRVAGAGTGVWTAYASGGERWLLVGSRGFGGEDARQVKERCTILLKAPTWYISLDGERWGVAIAWTIIDNG